MKSYADCRAALARAETPVGVAECHGVLCGLLCSPDGASPARWPEEVTGDLDPHAVAVRDLAALLAEMRVETAAQIGSPDCTFGPLLPADDEPIEIRARALTEWCSGFLYGLGSGGCSDLSMLSVEAREVISDFGEFTRIETGGEEGDSEENDYTELVEYLRVGTMLVHQDMAGGNPADATEKLVH